MTADGPWTADRVLDADGAARAIREALPDLAVRDVRLLGKGWDFDAYEADGRWVFRFPRRAAEQTRLAKELALLGWLGDTLDVPIPRYAWGALEASSFPYTFSGYPKLEGVQAATLDPATLDLETLGRRVGAQMRALHDAEPPTALHAMLESAREALTPRSARDGKARYIDTFCEHVDAPLAARARRFQTDDAFLVPDATATPCLLHDDLHVEHLLLDPDDPTRVVGWLDWGDACLGDPAREFGALVTWGGDVMLDALLDGYGDGGDALRARARFYGTCLGFVDWHHWYRIGNPDALATTTRTLASLLPA